MGILERKLREREERRRKIVDSARKLFLEKGLDTASLQDIADEAELSKAALYLYFRDKSGLLAEVLTASLQRLADIHAVAAAQAKTGLEKLRAWGQAFTTLCLDYPDDFYFIRLIEVLMLPLDKLLEDPSPSAQLINRFKIELMETFKQGTTDGSLRADLDCRLSAIVLSHLFISFMQSLAAQRDQLRTNTGYAPQQLIDHLFDLLIRGIVPPRQGESL